MTTTTKQWIAIIIAAWIASCWFFYDIGWLKGSTATNLEAAKVMSEIAGRQSP
jgi:hypothetical protein